jgi:hypothetical protein
VTEITNSNGEAKERMLSAQPKEKPDQVVGRAVAIRWPYSMLTPRSFPP